MLRYRQLAAALPMEKRKLTIINNSYYTVLLELTGTRRQDVRTYRTNISNPTDDRYPS